MNLHQRDLISVIVPVYKVEPYIRDCVDSILAQTYRNLEIILVDDGSPDACPAICDAYAAKDSRIQVIHKENGGLPDARNHGMNAATGEWLAFVDSDDIIAPSMIEFLWKNTTHENEICAIGFSRFTTGEALHYTTGATPVVCSGIHDFIRRHGGCFVWGKLYHRALIESMQLRFDPSLMNLEDVAFNMVYFSRMEHMHFLPDIQYLYRQNPTSITSRCSDKPWLVRSWFLVRNSVFTWFSRQKQSCNYDVLRYTVRYCANNIFAECIAGNLTSSDYVKLRITPPEIGAHIHELTFEKMVPKLYFFIYRNLMHLRNAIRS